MLTILIKNGRVVDPAGGRDGIGDVLVAGGRIEAVAAGLDRPPGAIVFDAAGLVVTPGLVDMHVHLREPGLEYKETIASGTAAAARGGFTAVACMPNTEPVVDNAALVRFILDKAREESYARVYPVAAISKGSRGENLTEMGDLAAAGAVAVSDDGRPVADAGLMRHALEYAAMFGLVVISHCEEPALARDGVMHEGYWSMALGLKGIPAVAEEAMVARDLLLAAYTGARLHLAHLSTAGSVRLVRQAKSMGTAVTAEATPHHFSLTDAAVAGYDTCAKVNPPLRAGEDVEAVIQGLAADTIDVIATDHAPHASHEKAVAYDDAPFGMVGLETAVPLVVTRLIKTGRLTWSQAVAKLSLNPCRVLGVAGGSLAAGSPADLTLIDPETVQRVDTSAFLSRARNSPFQGWELGGWPVATMVEGKWIWQEGKLQERVF